MPSVLLLLSAVAASMAESEVAERQPRADQGAKSGIPTGHGWVISDGRLKPLPVDKKGKKN